ncbi:Hypothetical predicted protein [Paramuricea clavata]|uniref:Uncharacterized protein n=1 Tax=Paramuricea clavata TaxID=317549 RepID=A0A6S7HQ66_PARCT|nr:Hypothetical predicted protein [Paramuricea clavata]
MYKKPMSKDSPHRQFIVDMLEFIVPIKGIDKQSEADVTNQLRCLEGLKMTLKDPTTSAEELRSFLRSCKRFSGSHTRTRIAAAFDDILETYVISNKVEYILTDNASNMKSTFKVNFPTEDDDDNVDDDALSVIQSHVLDDESIWETLDGAEDEIRDVLDNNCKKKLGFTFALISVYKFLWENDQSVSDEAVNSQTTAKRPHLNAYPEADQQNEVEEFGNELAAPASHWQASPGPTDFMDSFRKPLQPFDRKTICRKYPRPDMLRWPILQP